MPLRLLGSLLLMVTACGSEPRERLLAPTPKTLEVGEAATYLLDPGASSQVVTGGDLEITVVEKTDVMTTLVAKADVQTKFGPQKVVLKQAVANDVLSLDFLASLRDTKTFVGNGYTLRHTGLTREGCDELGLAEIAEYPNVALNLTLCAASRQAPLITVLVDLYGLPIRMVFKLAN